MKRIAITASAAVLVLLLCAVAMAQGGPGPDGGRQMMRRPPVLFGTITGIDKNTMTIRPEIPEQMKQRMEQNGRELPKLPESISVKLGEKTQWYFAGKAGGAADFAKGDQVVIKVGGGDEAGPVAEIVADPETAREYIMQKLHQARQGRRGEGPGGPGMGPGGGMGMGPDGGPGMGPGGGMGMAAGQGRNQGEGRQMRRPPVLFGSITAIEKNSLTIHPEIPEKLEKRMEQRREQRGKEMPKLPESVTFNVGPDTQWYQDGKAAERADFKKGDKVVVKVGEGDGKSPVAEIVADPKTAREFILDKIRERRQDGGPGMGPGMGPGGGQGMGPGGPGGPGGERKRPAFGTITKIGKDSVTIKPEIPDFIAAKMKERGVKPEAKLPESLTIKLGPDTKFVKEGKRGERGDFKAGDKIAVRLAPGAGDEPVAGVVSDYATAKQMMERMGQGPGGPGQEQGQQQGRAKKAREGKGGKGQNQ